MQREQFHPPSLNGHGNGSSNGQKSPTGIAADLTPGSGPAVLPNAPVVSPRRAAVSSAPQVEPELEFHEVFAALYRRRSLIGAMALAGILCGLAIGLLSTRKYSATATVEFAQPSARALGLENSPYTDADISTLELLNTELKTQESEITDDDTALAVIRRLHLDTQEPFAIPSDVSADDPLSRERGLPLEKAPYQRERVLKLFGQGLSVEVMKGTRLLNVTFTDTDPQRAAEVANAVVAASMDQTAGRSFRAFAQVSSWLADQLTTLKQTVEDTQRRAEEYENDNQTDLAGMTIATAAPQGDRTATTGTAESVPVSRLLALNTDLTNAEVARLAKEAIYRVAETGDPDAVLGVATSPLVNGAGADSPLAPGNGGLALLQQLRAQQVQTNVQIAAAATRYGAKNEVMLGLRRQQAELDAQMNDEMSRLRKRAKDDLDMAVAAETGLRQQVTTQQAEVSQWTSKADHLLLLQGEAASSRALYQDLYTKLQESQFAAGIRASRLSVLDPARVPTRPSAPKRKLDVLLGLLVGTVFGVIACFALELFDDSLHTEGDVQKIVGVRPLVSIPQSPKRAGRDESWASPPAQSAVAEAYRSFRTRIFGPGEGAAPRVVLVASAKPHEGKATACVNTAMALAAQGHRVVVVNADLRRSAVAGPLGEFVGSGLSAYLAGEAALRDVLAPLGDTGRVFVLPAGPVPDQAYELLGSSRLRDLFRQLRSQFDYILVNSPPALLFSDAQLMLPYVDAHVVVARASVTDRADLRRTVEELQGAGDCFLGVLLNGASAKKPSYSKYGYGL